ncbi:MAG: hypothetical protein J2P31_06770 [Blastocatellia bacterium]|nr:hypothetical protein [Blastocatellia bacterium]
MKKRLVRMTIAGMMLAGVFSITGLAQGYYRYHGLRNVENREAYQRSQIREGIRNGSITRSEAHKLYGEQRKIESYERRSLRDGRLDYHERQRLDRMLDHSRRDIYHQKHDDEYYRHRRWW